MKSIFHLLKRFLLWTSFFSVLGHSSLYGSIDKVESSLTEVEKSELAEWGSLRQGKGALLTPPRGRISKEAKKMRAYVTNLVHKIGGEKLKEGDYNYVINIYADPGINAWVQQFDPKRGKEKKWKKENSEVWPIRALLGFADNDKPIYEIGVTTGLLLGFHYEDEVAFVLGHELMHLFEGHTDASGSFVTHLLASQSEEGVADIGGIELILGKWELDFAISAMERIYEKYKKPEQDGAELKTALQAAMSSHHSPGVRLSAMQFYIEKLRRSDSRALPIAPTPIPDEVKYTYRKRKGKKPGELKRLREAILPLVNNHFLTGKKLESLDTEYDRYSELKDPLKQLDLSYAEKPELVHVWQEAFQIIIDSDASKKTKVNAYLKTSFLIAKYVYTQDYIKIAKLMHKTDLPKISMFLAKNSSGEDGWKFADFKEFATKVGTMEYQPLAKIFLMTKDYQGILARLKKVYPAWQEFFDSLTELNHYNEDGVFETHRISHKYYGLLDMEVGPLGNEFWEKVANNIANIPSETLLEHQWQPGIPGFKLLMGVTQLKRYEKDHQLRFKDLLAEVIAPTIELYNERNFDSLVSVLSDKEADYNQQLTQLNTYINHFEKVTRSPEEWAKTYPYVVQFIESISKRDDAKPLGKISFWLQTDREAFLYFTDILTDGRFTKSEKEAVLKFTAAFFPINIGVNYGKNKEKIDQNLVAFFKNYSSEELISLFTQRIPAFAVPVDQAIDNLPDRTLPKKQYMDELRKMLKKADEEGTDFSLVWREIRDLGEKDFASQMATLMFAALNESSKQMIVDGWNKDDLVRVIGLVEKSRNRAHFISSYTWPNDGYYFEKVPKMVGELLLEKFIKHHSEFDDLGIFVHNLKRLRKMLPEGYLFSTDQKRVLRLHIEGKLKDLKPGQKKRWLRKKIMKEVLTQKYMAAELANYVLETVPETSNITGMTTAYNKLHEEFKMDSRMELSRLFKENLAEAYNLQPYQLTSVFGENNKSYTESTKGLEGQVIGLSALIALARELNYDEQVDLIEFLMGRKQQEPDFIPELQEKMSIIDEDTITLSQLLEMIRYNLASRSALQRSFVVNSIITGQQGILADAEGEKKLRDHILQSVNPKNRRLADKIVDALFVAEDHNVSFFFAYVLAQKEDQVDDQDSSLSEALVIKSLLDAYGVPGVKLAQYLAFSEDFGEYQETLETYQDAAMPVSYYGALMLINERLGDNWDPERYKIKKILGSGSVNLAILYKDLQENETRVLNIGREDIIVKTKEDFRRFKLLIEALTDNEESREEFAFVLGLMDIIERSVSLEFDKKNAYEMQYLAYRTYNHQVGEWKIKSVPVHNLYEMSMTMGLANGKTARKILKSDPKTYNSAMAALLEVEFQVLRGINSSGNWKPLPLLANPDLHDGQVLIDKEKKTVTIIDFGQALEISNKERLWGIDILRIITKSESPANAAKILNRYSNGTLITKAMMEKLFERKDRMDIFVHLISELFNVGVEIPLSTVHWVLGANRLMVLGKKVGAPIKIAVGGLILSRKVRLPLHGYNGIFESYTGAEDKVQELWP